MSRYVYLAIFEPEDDFYNVIFPDLPNCYTCGDNLADALHMAEDVLGGYLSRLEEKGEPVPSSHSENITVTSGAITSLILADTDEYRRLHSNRAVKKTLTIPSWLNEAAEARSINFSQVLQEALRNTLGF